MGSSVAVPLTKVTLVALPNAVGRVKLFVLPDLGVGEATLAAHGAVSHETAIEMARGALARTGAALALATTGVAGPSGGSDAKPVGTVYIALAARGGAVVSRRFHFPGDRITVRSRTAHLALACARFALLGEATRPLLWAEGEACRVERT
jgi:PncC family amidohydrolase